MRRGGLGRGRIWEQSLQHTGGDARGDVALEGWFDVFENAGPDFGLVASLDQPRGHAQPLA